MHVVHYVYYVFLSCVHAGAGSESETSNVLAPPPEESHPTSISIANQTVATQDNISASCPDDGQSTLIHTRPGEILLKKVSTVPGR